MRTKLAVVVVVLATGCGGATPIAENTPEAPRRECTAALRFQEPPASEEPAAEVEERAPRTEVSLVLICENERPRRVAVGSEIGACFGIEAGEALLRARCWWAGEGAIVEVRREDDALVVRRASIDEHTGTGDFEDVSRLEVPADADVRPL